MKIHNKILFFSGAIIFVGLTWYTAAKGLNGNLFLNLLIFVGIFIMMLGLMKPREKKA